MTTQMRLDTLTKLSESDLVLANSDEDIRGRTLRDTNDEEIGSVDDLMIDADQRKVRFLLVGAGGFLGIGEKQFLIPVDAVTRIDDDNVWINQNKSKIVGSPKPSARSCPSSTDDAGLAGFHRA